MTDSSDSSSPSPAAPSLRADISAISLKIPPFWPSDQEVWFAQVEATFTTRGISMQKTKFDHVIASLSPEVAVEIGDLILKPQTDHPFNVLRRELIRRTAKSEQHKLQQLFTAEQLGDHKPTHSGGWNHFGRPCHLYRQCILKGAVPSEAPIPVRMVLAYADDSVSLAQLAQLADKILELAVPSSVASVETPSSLASDVEQLRAQVSELQETIKNLRSPSHPPRPPSLSRSCSPPPALLYLRHSVGIIRSMAMLPKSVSHHATG